MSGRRVHHLAGSPLTWSPLISALAVPSTGWMVLGLRVDACWGGFGIFLAVSMHLGEVKEV